MTRRPLLIALTAWTALAGSWSEAAAYKPPVFGIKWGSFGSAAGQFNYANGIACDASGAVYVADTWNHRIQKFSGDGAFLAQWGSQGDSAGQFYVPGYVAIDGGGFVYVTDIGNYRIQKFTSSGTYVTQWGSHGTGNGQFERPVGIAVDASGDIYVSEPENGRIQVFSNAGAYKREWNATLGKSYKVTGISFASNGHAFVLLYNLVTNGGCQVAEFTSTGTLVQIWSAPTAVANTPTAGARGIAIDALDRVLITDSSWSRVWVCDANGNVLGYWGVWGYGSGQFRNPSAMAVHGDRVFVMDWSNYRVQRFSYTTTFAFYPSLSTVNWHNSGSSLSIHLGYDNPSTESLSLPLAGWLRPQLYGAFLPSLPMSIAEFSVPPLPPGTHFDVFADVPLDLLPPPAPLFLAGGGPAPGGVCTPAGWSGGIDLVWTEGEETAHSDWWSSDVPVGPGAVNSYVGIVTGCTPTSEYRWRLEGLSPGFIAALFEEDRVTRAPDLLPPGWHGFVGVMADAAVLPGTQCCLNLILRCDEESQRVEVCARACPWSTTDVAPGLTSRETGILGIAPNPASLSTTIRFALADDDRATLDVLDVAGRRVSTVWDGALPRGEHVRTWDRTGANGHRLPAGTYFIRLRTTAEVSRKTIILTR